MQMLEPLPLIKHPASVLRAPAQPVGEHLHDPEVAEVIQTMLATMMELSTGPRGCAGLAANQVGALWRVALVNERPPHGPIHVMIDPVVTRAVGARSVSEGCLSVDNPVATLVRRAKIVGARWTTPAGATQRVHHARGFFAQALQHEIDHLDGKLFLDRVDGRAL